MSRVQKHKSKKPLIAVLAVLLVLAVLTAVWFFVINRKYTVVFNTSGGSPVETLKLKNGETVPRPADPVKEGYVFKDWVCSGRPYEFGTPVTEDLTIFAVYKESVPANSIFFLEDKFYVAVGKTLMAGIVLDPVNASSPVVYSSSNPAVAVIDASGCITGVSSGTAIIKAQIENLSATAEVEVSSEITSLSFELKEYTVAVGESVSAVVKIFPEDAEDKTLSYISTDSNIASVDENGVIRGVRTGEAVIIAAAKNGVEARTKVLVGKAVESLILDPSEGVLELAEGKTFSFTVKALPADALPSVYRWSSSNTNIADVDRSGVVTAKSPGTVTITCISSNGKIARAKLTVARRAESVSADSYDIQLNKGETADLYGKLKFTPADVKSQYTAVWTVKSGNSSVSVDSKGIVRGLAVTEKPAVVEAVLTGVLGDKITLSFNISVQGIPAEFISLEGFSLEEDAELVLNAGESYKIKAKLLPENTTDKNITYSLDTSGIVSSYADKSSCVKVSSDGTVTAAHGFEGFCIVIVTAENGIQREIKVYANEEILLFEADGKQNPDSLTLHQGGSGIAISFTRVSYRSGEKNASAPSLSEIDIVDKSGSASAYFVFSGGRLCLADGFTPEESFSADIVFRCGSLKTAAVNCKVLPAEE